MKVSERDLSSASGELTDRLIIPFARSISRSTASVNPHGNDCPPALKLIACVLLLEITAFLRETYQTLPKASRLSTKEKQAPWDKVSR